MANLCFLLAGCGDHGGEQRHRLGHSLSNVCRTGPCSIVQSCSSEILTSHEYKHHSVTYRAGPYLPVASAVNLSISALHSDEFSNCIEFHLPGPPFRAKCGAYVDIIAPNKEEIKHVEDQMRKEKIGKCCSFVADVRDPQQV